MACLPSIGTVMSMAGPGWCKGGLCCRAWWGRWSLCAARIRPGLPQVPLAEDQQMIQALAAQRATA
jgi:hypothetical protein